MHIYRHDIFSLRVYPHSIYTVSLHDFLYPFYGFLWCLGLSRFVYPCFTDLPYWCSKYFAHYSWAHAFVVIIEVVIIIIGVSQISGGAVLSHSSIVICFLPSFSLQYSNASFLQAGHWIGTL